MTLAIVGDTANTDSATAYNSIAANLLDVTLRVAKYKGGWDLQLKLAGLDKFSYQTQFTEFTGGDLMVQAINANAIDIASARNYAAAINVDESIVYQDEKEGLEQRCSQLLPVSNEAIASQQKVADTFYKAGVISSKVNVKPLWDNTFTEAITKCK